jgi:transmembrane 9 superfamily protein 2/4
LSAAGAYFGFRHPAFEAPSKTNQIPRQIPAQSIFLNKWNAAIMGGILPFGAIFIELYFILSSFWSHRIY